MTVDFCQEPRCSLPVAKTGLKRCTVHIPLSVVCPKCNSQPEAKCRSMTSGKELYQCHSIRFIVARREFDL